MEAVETHPGVKEIVGESWLFVKDGDPRYFFDDDQTTIITQATG